MTRPRQHPCPRCRSIWTDRGETCANCHALGDAAPVPEDRFADVRAAARKVSTPETRRMAPAPVMPPVGLRGQPVRALEQPAPYRSELPTLGDGPTIHEAITKIADAIAAGLYPEARLRELVAEAERLKQKYDQEIVSQLM